ncbi:MULTISPECIES: hypothetical protein [unclassified Streptomyces]|nr:hypothetical protein [Streptomyces sp. DH41]MDG9723072.1 hypothetical protein [Streptomyces sp. DH41]
MSPQRPRDAVALGAVGLIAPDLDVRVTVGSLMERPDPRFPIVTP